SEIYPMYGDNSGTCSADRIRKLRQLVKYRENEQPLLRHAYIKDENAVEIEICYQLMFGYDPKVILEKLDDITMFKGRRKRNLYVPPLRTYFGQSRKPRLYALCQNDRPNVILANPAFTETKKIKE